MISFALSSHALIPSSSDFSVVKPALLSFAPFVDELTCFVLVFLPELFAKIIEER